GDDARVLGVEVDDGCHGRDPGIPGPRDHLVARVLRQERGDDGMLASTRTEYEDSHPVRVPVGGEPTFSMTRTKEIRSADARNAARSIRSPRTPSFSTGRNSMGG